MIKRQNKYIPFYFEALTFESMFDDFNTIMSLEFRRLAKVKYQKISYKYNERRRNSFLPKSIRFEHVKKAKREKFET